MTVGQSRGGFIQALAATAMSAAIDSSANAAERRKNVLFIGVDDHNASLGCYTNGLVHTPHLDNLAERGTRFDAAYCQYPLCSPSRTSLMTGMAPDATKVYDNLAPSFRSALPSAVTLSQLFRKNGYFSARVGKIYHQGVPARIGESGPDDPKGWDYVFNPCGVDHTKEEPLVTNFGPDIGDLGKEIAFRESEAPDKSMTDSIGADEVIRLLRQRHTKPFFLAYGLYRPHVPWIVPKAYFGLYPLGSIQACPFSEAELTVAPAPAYTTHPTNWNE
jgi:iduronate 2-sulfatase